MSFKMLIFSLGDTITDEPMNPLFFYSPPNAESAFLEMFLRSFNSFYEAWFAMNACAEDIHAVGPLIGPHFRWSALFCVLQVHARI